MSNGNNDNNDTGDKGDSGDKKPDEKVEGSSDSSATPKTVDESWSAPAELPDEAAGKEHVFTDASGERWVTNVFDAVQPDPELLRSLGMEPGPGAEPAEESASTEETEAEPAAEAEAEAEADGAAKPAAEAEAEPEPEPVAVDPEIAAAGAAIRARAAAELREAEALAKAAEEAKADDEDQASADAARAKTESSASARAKAKAEEEARERAEADLIVQAKAREEAAKREKAEAEARVKAEAAAVAKAEAEAEAQARAEAEAEERARVEAAALAEAEARAKDKAERAARKMQRANRKNAGPSKGLAVSEESAGAGVIGLLGFFALFFVALIFFVTENFFVAMLLISIALLVYVAGSELAKLLISSITIFFSSRHLIRNATYLQDTLAELRKFLYMKKDESGWVKVGPIDPGAKAKLPDNPLVRDIQACLKREKGREYTEFVAHEYYVDCRELYDHFHSHLHFVAGAMPLFGLIGTIIGLIGMFDSLGANVSVEVLSPQLALALKTTLYGAVFASMYTIIASRFDQRIKALEYDYEILCRALDVMVENKAIIEVQA